MGNRLGYLVNISGLIAGAGLTQPTPGFALSGRVSGELTLAQGNVSNPRDSFGPSTKRMAFL